MAKKPTPEPCIIVFDNGSQPLYVVPEGPGAIGHKSDGTKPVRYPSHTFESFIEQATKGLHGEPLAYQRVEPGLLEPLEYHPRIMRPRFFPITEEDHDNLRHIRRVFSLLCARLERIFDVIEPRGVNLKAFGHEIRALLVLAANDVEAQFKAVLRANKHPNAGGNTNANDYADLFGPMRLEDRTAELPLYPGLGKLRPFAREPLKAAPAWWRAYTDVKHDADAKLESATLLHAAEAVAAYLCLAQGQYGRNPTHFDAPVVGNGPPYWAPTERYYGDDTDPSTPSVPVPLFPRMNEKGAPAKSQGAQKSKAKKP